MLIWQNPPLLLVALGIARAYVHSQVDCFAPVKLLELGDLLDASRRDRGHVSLYRPGSAAWSWPGLVLTPFHFLDASCYLGFVPRILHKCKTFV